MAFPSTFLDLQRLVINKVRLDANADAATGSDLQFAKDMVNLAYSEACVLTEAKQGEGTNSLTSGIYSYQLPPDVVRVKTIMIAPADGSQGYGNPLTEASPEDMFQRRQNDGHSAATGSVASHYALVGVNQLELWPTPGAADTILFVYVGQPTPLSANTDVPILPEPYGTKAIQYLALAEAADFLKDPDVDRYRALADLWLKKLQTHMRRLGGGHVRSLPVARGTFVPHLPSTDVAYRY